MKKKELSLFLVCFHSIYFIGNHCSVYSFSDEFNQISFLATKTASLDQLPFPKFEANQKAQYDYKAFSNKHKEDIKWKTLLISLNQQRLQSLHPVTKKANHLFV